MIVLREEFERTIMAEKIVELIYREYYGTIFRYCRVRLNGDIQGAEDCAQEVFLILHKKIKKLVELDSILPWLYQTADREIRTYRRKHPETVAIDEVPEPIVPFEEESVLDHLNEEDRRFIEQYYSGIQKTDFAKQYGISVDALYKRVQRIRKKLSEHLDNMHK